MRRGSPTPCSLLLCSPSSTPGSSKHKIIGGIFPINVSRFRTKNVRMSVLPALLEALLLEYKRDKLLEV